MADSNKHILRRIADEVVNGGNMLAADMLFGSLFRQLGVTALPAAAHA
jgi:hypothetical protein